MHADIASFRKAERERLIAARLAIPAEVRASHTAKIAAALDQLLGAATEEIVSLYWPIRAEPDLRPWMRAACERGLAIALPVAVELGRPLTFRAWRPGAVMARGLWQIPYPAEGPEITPTTLLAPLVGFDAASYRLGYGGGFFDRTLAAIRSPTALGISGTRGTRARVIGVGYRALEIPTIHPQPHDVPMDVILTEEASRFRA